MPLIPIAMALAQFAPVIAGWLGGSKAEDVATKVVGIAQAVTGQSAPDAALAALQADPNLALQFQKAVLEQQAQLAQIAADVTKAELAADTANASAVNQTMQIEARSDHWPTYSWRPFVGFCFGVLALISGLTVACAYLGVMFLHADPKVLTDIPGMLGAEAAVMATMAPVLGIASYFRGKMQANPVVATDNRG
ncbi:3TM-type holin [Burkholderia vietnamiensis]|uniref:3TM-type holin n=1 Tax=Burkholderia vietnamiensis TaxID=60552 RepID=UPI0026539F68|nr:3TM-type holin [Burkholderia vietnamiensis]MDN7814678.1 3TM-type holin [Burkholderia vietnamiensis]MDN8066342.1 3TM-type holin [Burkholderia vietnamiensis]